MDAFTITFRLVDLKQIPWTRLGSEPVNITIDGLELRCRMRKPQTPDYYTPSADYKEQFDYDADRRTSKSSSYDRLPNAADELDQASTDRHAVSTQDPGYLAILLRKAKINARVTVKNINVQYYISSEVVLNITIPELDFCPTDAAWKPTYISLPPSGGEFELRRQINVKNFSVEVSDRRNLKRECRDTGDKVVDSGTSDVNSELLKPCSFTCRSETTYSNFLLVL